MMNDEVKFPYSIFHIPSLFSKFSTRAKLVLVGNFGATNVGDECILAGFLRKLNSVAPRAEIIVLSANLRESKKWHAKIAFAKVLPSGVRSLFSGGLFATLRAIKNSDAVIFPGGGLFTDEENWRAIFLWGLHILAARFFWKPVYLFGQSIGPFRTEFGKNFARFVFGKADLIGTRDAASVRELLALGIPKFKIKAGEDSALELRIKNKGLRIKRAKKTGMKVLVSVRDYPRLPADFFSRLARKLDTLAEKQKAKIIFVPFESGRHDDRRAWQKICALSKNSSRWQMEKAPYGAEKVLNFIRGFDLVVGMRLHSLILAHLAGVPTLPFAYSQKVEEWGKKL